MVQIPSPPRSLAITVTSLTIPRIKKKTREAHGSSPTSKSKICNWGWPEPNWEIGINNNNTMSITVTASLQVCEGRLSQAASGTTASLAPSAPPHQQPFPPLTLHFITRAQRGRGAAS